MARGAESGVGTLPPFVVVVPLGLRLIALGTSPVGVLPLWLLWFASLLAIACDLEGASSPCVEL